MPDDEDKEFDPEHPVLRFGMSKAELDEVKRRVKEGKKRKNRSYKPLTH